MKRRLDEVVRAVRWHRLAQPFGVGDKVAIDTVNLRDNWRLEKNESWINKDGGSDINSEAPCAYCPWGAVSADCEGAGRQGAALCAVLAVS